MDVAGGTFRQKDPTKIAYALERDAEKSNRRKSSPYRSAMSMLTFYINRAGTNLSARQLKVLEDAKAVLRAEFGPKKAALKKTEAKKSGNGTSTRERRRA